MGDAFWKAFERRVAALFGGKRRGADVDGGKTDIIKSGWAIEVKTRKVVSYGLVLEAINQAKENAESETDIPVAVLKRKGESVSDAIVAMNIMDFVRHFVD